MTRRRPTREPKAWLLHRGPFFFCFEFGDWEDPLWCFRLWLGRARFQAARGTVWTFRAKRGRAARSLHVYTAGLALWFRWVTRAEHEAHEAMVRESQAVLPPFNPFRDVNPEVWNAVHGIPTDESGDPQSSERPA